MKNRKQLETLLTSIKLIVLIGSLMLSFYLLYSCFEEGEQAVSGTAVRINEIIDTVDTGEISVRVRILDSTWSEQLFDEISVCSADTFIVEWGTFTEADAFVSASARESGEAGQTQEDDETGQTKDSDETDLTAQRIEANQTCKAGAGDMEPGDVLRLYSPEGRTLTVTSLTRADGSPEYSGELFIYRMEDGLFLVNELPLEEYLYAVVSSEMPSYFPEEALKAQAVCARTYALQWLEERKNSTDRDGKKINEKNLTDLNDSASFQVYNNRKSTQASVSAVDATCGEVLLADEIQYYSTSVLSEHRDDLGEEDAFRTFLEETPEEGAEYGSSWIRWQAEIPIERILENLETLYAEQWEEEDLDRSALTESAADIAVVSRSGNGQVQSLAVTVGTATFAIEGEYAVRQLLAPGDTEVVLMDGSTVSGMQLLPSAFFYIEGGTACKERAAGDDAEAVESYAAEDDGNRSDGDVICIYGGGYGHGNGMSQYGAAQMAADGSSCLEILEYYFGYID